ncbi:MAG: hypothetical protein JW751_22920 [Polyangiaceae bacterium]|nr:hypothetical protein [Polyangiaceae bacterium]
MTKRTNLLPLGPSTGSFGSLCLLLATVACAPGSAWDDEPGRYERKPGCINACYYDPFQHDLEDGRVDYAVDCAAAEEGTEFYPLSIWSMESNGFASNMYGYYDWTTPYSYVVSAQWQPPANATLEWPGGALEPGAPPEVGNVPRCIGDDTNGVFHLFGGPFHEWGGGVGRGMKCMNRSSLLGEIKVGEDTFVPPDEAATYNKTDVSCGEGPDIQGVVSGGACALLDADDDDTVRLIKSACPDRDRKAQEEGRESAGEEEFLLGMTLDMSEWEGISFWARRSPNSQPGIRVAVGDRFTDDDLRYLQYHINPGSKPLCERRRECGCNNSRPCTENQSPVAGVYCEENGDCNFGQNASQQWCVDGRCRCSRDQECPYGWCDFSEGGKYGDSEALDGFCRAMSWCYDPEIDPAPDSWVSAGGLQVFPPCRKVEDCTDGAVCEPAPYGGASQRICRSPGDPKAVNRITYPQCGEAQCNAFYKPFQVGDAQFNGRECTPFSYRGSVSDSFCFNPGEDPDPPEGVDLCGDFWLSPVYLTTEWQFYKVPFTELHQQGWAKEQYEFDLTSVSVVRFTWDRGWIDYWIDDVRFYRDQR